MQTNFSLPGKTSSSVAKKHAHLYHTRGKWGCESLWRNQNILKTPEAVWKNEKFKYEWNWKVCLWNLIWVCNLIRHSKSQKSCVYEKCDWNLRRFETKTLQRKKSAVINFFSSLCRLTQLRKHLWRKNDIKRQYNCVENVIIFHQIRAIKVFLCKNKNALKFFTWKIAETFRIRTLQLLHYVDIQLNLLKKILPSCLLNRLPKGFSFHFLFFFALSGNKPN